MKKIAIFASGSGTNFEALADAAAKGELGNAEVVVCVCDKPGAKVIDRAESRNIPTLVFSPKDFKSKNQFERIIADKLDGYGVDLICLAGYMRIVGEELLSRYEGKILNIHPALLPSFKGAHAIRDAFDFGVKVYGVTIHYIDNTIDGGVIVDQAAFHYDGKDIEELEQMIHDVEHQLYPATVAKVIEKM